MGIIFDGSYRVMTDDDLIEIYMFEKDLARLEAEEVIKNKTWQNLKKKNTSTLYYNCGVWTFYAHAIGHRQVLRYDESIGMLIPEQNYKSALEFALRTFLKRKDFKIESYLSTYKDEFLFN